MVISTARKYRESRKNPYQIVQIEIEQNLIYFKEINDPDFIHSKEIKNIQEVELNQIGYLNFNYSLKGYEFLSR